MVKALAVLLLLGCSASTALCQEPEALPHPYFQTYEQTVTVTLKDAAAAAQARVEALPLYGGRDHAVTCRWDDNAYGRAETVAAKAAAVGIKGTLFVNAPHGTEQVAKFRKMVKGFVEAGQTIGSHGWTHPTLSSMNPNAIFEDTVRMRVFTEQQMDAPVCSYAWAFMDTGRYYLGEDGVRCTAEALFRSGHHCHAQAFGLDVGSVPLAPAIGAPYSDKSNGPLGPETYATFIAGLVQRKKEPSSYIMPIHPAWYKDVDAEIARVKSVAGNPAYWYCTMDEYGAYRNQFLTTQIEPSVEGNRLVLTIKRPALLDLGNPVPLTLVVTGCPKDAVTGIVAARARVERCDGDDVARFDLHHDEGMRLPRKIGAVFNEENADTIDAVAQDAELPELRGVLHYAADRLTWTLANAAGRPLEGVRLTLRLPQAFADGFHVVNVPDIADGETRSGTFELKRATDDYRYLYGRGFFVLQVDGSAGGEDALRLHLTTSAALTDQRDAGYPKGGFAVLGPVAADQWREGMDAALAKAPDDGLTLADGTRLEFVAEEPEVAGERLPGTAYDAAYVLTAATWRTWGEEAKRTTGRYVLRSSVTCPEACEHVLLVPEHVTSVFVNGQAAPTVDLKRRGFKGFTCVFRKGANDLMIAVGPPLSGSYALKPGLFMRMQTQDGDRATDIAYECPR